MTLSDFRMMTLLVSVLAMLEMLAYFCLLARAILRGIPPEILDGIAGAKILNRALWVVILFDLLVTLSEFPPEGFWRDAYRLVDNCYCIFYCVYMSRPIFRALDAWKHGEGEDE